MKLISLVLLFVSFVAMADETCSTSLFDFKITKKYILASGNGQTLKYSYDEVRSLSRRNQSDFMQFVSTLTNEISTDEVMTQAELGEVERFSLTVADDYEELIGMMYAKGYNKQGYLVVRYMLTDDGAYRCK